MMRRIIEILHDHSLKNQKILLYNDRVYVSLLFIGIYIRVICLRHALHIVILMRQYSRR